MPKSSQLPESVQPGIPELLTPPSGWSAVRFGEVLRIVERPVELEDSKEYQLVIAKRNRGGIVARERLTGKNILTKTQFLTHAGDFLISRRQIVHGACGLVPTHLDGSVVSNEYSTLLPVDHLNSDFLAYYIHSRHFQETCFNASVGVDVEKMVFKIQEWLERHEMLLPPLSEQQRIAEILGSVDEAIRANSAVLHQASRLQAAIADRLVWGITFRSEPLSSCVEAITAGRSPEADSDPADHESWGVLKVSAIGFGKFFPYENKALTRDLIVDPRFRVRAGDLLITRANTSALVGASCVVPQGTYRLMLSDKTLRLEVSTGKVDANYLCIALLTARVRRQISERASGTSGSMKNISQPSLLEVRVPLPAMDVQLKISDAMNKVSAANDSAQAQLDTLRKLKHGLLQALLSRKLKVKGR